MYPIFINHSSIDVHLGGFRSLAAVKTVTKTLTYTYLYGRIQSPQRYNQECGIRVTWQLYF